MWAGVSGAHGGEAVMMPFAFRQSGALKGCHYRGSDEDTQGGWVFILGQLFSTLLHMV